MGYTRKMGFYYQQQPQGFYYNQPQQGFYYNQPQQQGFYYNNQKPQGFYYNQQPKQGFYYDQGFYYNQPQGFYYDEQDAEHGKFNKENKDYWYKGAGKKRAVAALNGLRTLVDKYVSENPHAANETQGAALSNVITVQVVREVIKKFVKNVNPVDFFKNKGDAKKTLTVPCQGMPGCPRARKGLPCQMESRGIRCPEAMDKVSNELVPFMVTWA